MSLPISLYRKTFVGAFYLAIVCLGTPSTTLAEPRNATYRVNHSLTLKDLPAGTKKVRIWFWFPDDDAAQKVLDIAVPTAPAGYRITRDADCGNRYLHAEVENPGETPIVIKTDFLVHRTAVSMALDPAKAGELTELHRTVLKEYLRRDCPNMEVNERLSRLADEICGQETNVVLQARRLYDYVVTNTDHYSKANAPKSSGKGCAEYCLDMKGGGCTDQHSLFIALARARGIPTRLQFGTLLRSKNEGKDMDPGYRCWVQYFVPNYGWVPMDISAGNTTPGEKDFYFSGLDERRIHFLEGRDLVLGPPQAGPRLNLMIIAYVEVDGQPYTKFERTLKFTEIKTGKAQVPVRKDGKPGAGPTEKSSE